MAEQKKEAQAAGFGQKAARFFRELRSESKKIVWPSKKTVINNTIVVFATMLGVGVVVWVFDWLITLLRNLILGF